MIWLMPAGSSRVTPSFPIFRRTGGVFGSMTCFTVTTICIGRSVWVWSAPASRHWARSPEAPALPIHISGEIAAMTFVFHRIVRNGANAHLALDLFGDMGDDAGHGREDGDAGHLRRREPHLRKNCRHHADLVDHNLRLSRFRGEGAVQRLIPVAERPPDALSLGDLLQLLRPRIDEAEIRMTETGHPSLCGAHLVDLGRCRRVIRRAAMAGFGIALRDETA